MGVGDEGWGVFFFYIEIDRAAGFFGVLWGFAWLNDFFRYIAL